MPRGPVICPDCRQANPTDSRFCEECGGALMPSCHACGAEMPLTARFCRSCGAAVEHAGITDPAAGRKVVTVLFADLAGSTAFQERLDAESVRAVMARFYEAMRAVIEEHGGRLQKFIGDAVVAVFGTPHVREDDALRAVRAAASMSFALERLNDELERDFALRLDMRIGVNTGELVVAQGSADGAIGDADLVVGDVMNTAARLEQAAGAGRDPDRRGDEASGARWRAARTRGAAGAQGQVSGRASLAARVGRALEGSGEVTPRGAARRAPARARAPARRARRCDRNARLSPGHGDWLPRRGQDAPGAGVRASASATRQSSKVTASHPARGSRYSRSPRCCEASRESARPTPRTWCARSSACLVEDRRIARSFGRARGGRSGRRNTILGAGDVLGAAPRSRARGASGGRS